MSSRLKPLAEPREIIDQKGRMRLACRHKTRIDADMQAHTAALEPATARGKVIRLGHFMHSEQVGVECARCVFTTLRNGDVDVIETDNRHGRSPKPALPARSRHLLAAR